MISLKPLGVDRDKHVVVVDGRCFSNCRAVCLKADIVLKCCETRCLLNNEMNTSNFSRFTNSCEETPP